METVQKPDGTIKHRETTDYAAAWVKARQVWRQWRLRMLTRKDRSGRLARRLSTKGRPGPNSFNACLDPERVGDLTTEIGNFDRFDYGMHSLRIGREAELRGANVRPELINDITSHTTIGGRAPYSRAERLELVKANRFPCTLPATVTTHRATHPDVP